LFESDLEGSEGLSSEERLVEIEASKNDSEFLCPEKLSKRCFHLG
jgi:hypothetical protein